MIKKLVTVILLISVTCLAVITGCKKDTPSEPLEPISLIHPDTSVIRAFPSDIIPVEIKFTTDRPINWVKGMYDIDSTNTTGYAATYPDTLFFQKLDTVNPRVNLYTYTGSYLIPDSLDPYDIVRFKISFEAGSSSFVTGQNYPAGKVTSSKEFRIDVR